MGRVIQLPIPSDPLARFKALDAQVEVLMRRLWPEQPDAEDDPVTQFYVRAAECAL